MTEPDQIEFLEHVGGREAGQPGGPLARSVPVRIGIVAASAALFVVGAVAAMGASPSPTSSTANPDGGAVPGTPFDGTLPKMGPLGGFGFEFRGGVQPGGFHDITISSIEGSSLSLQTDDGWARTITVGGSTTITKGGQTIGDGDLKKGDQVAFTESKATDGSYSISAIRVILPTLAGQVTAVGSDTITVSDRGGGSATIHLSSTTTYDVSGNASAKLSDITTGSFVVAEGTLRSDGSLDASAVHGGTRVGRDGGDMGPMFRGGPNDPDHPQANPNATPNSPSSAS